MDYAVKLGKYVSGSRLWCPDKPQRNRDKISDPLRTMFVFERDREILRERERERERERP